MNTTKNEKRVGVFENKFFMDLCICYIRNGQSVVQSGIHATETNPFAHS